ncbi:MAG: hypothetical protein ACD_76C00084G0002 [uncultured bacterium]|nr:MAG: hypothetical protein ACD_76C00084G0002 [uncultured bacterium]HBD05547.1 TlyA family rRNA (cytidine-2'-O)-methyltransferase [Candidatus Uhrbacteria bacterium]
MAYASRAGEKLEHALREFKTSVLDKTCADFGSSTGGFVDALLAHGAARVYAVETGYGVLDWKLRNDKRVIVMERTNAMHVLLPELMDIISIDTSWTKLKNVLPSAINNLKPNGFIIALLKPHYEVEQKLLRAGTISEKQASDVVQRVCKEIESTGLSVLKQTKSPIKGGKGGNVEYLLLIARGE